MLKKLALVKGQGGYFAGKMGIIVAICDQQISREERTCLFKLLVDGQISGWMPGECLNILEDNPSQDEAM